MQELWDKIKAFFKDKLNLTATILIIIFIIMLCIPIKSDIYIRFNMLPLSGALFIIAYKFYKRHRGLRDVYDSIDCTKQEKRETTFSKVSNGFEKAERYNNLTFALAFGAIAVIILLVVIFK